MQNKVRESKECMQVTYDSKEQPLGKGFVFDPKFKPIASDSIIKEAKEKTSKKIIGLVLFQI